MSTLHLAYNKMTMIERKCSMNGPSTRLGPSARLRRDAYPIFYTSIFLLAFIHSRSLVHQVGAFVPRAVPSRNSNAQTRPPSVFPHLYADESIGRKISAPFSRSSSSSRTSSTILPAVAALQLITETYESAKYIAQTTADAYGASLIENPLPTKSLTAGVLCGISDVIAQRRDPNRGEYNIGRTVRFASKGCIGGIIWTFWYNWIDGFLSFDESFNNNSPTSLNIYSLTGAVTNASLLLFVKSHVGAVTTFLSILLEQFIWCPLVYGTFEIPVSTLMNGGELAGVKNEVDAKLNGLLVSNAKVWTLANLIIYNAPLEWRLFIGNVIDIFWQSIVSDVSADCGKAGDDVCEIPDDDDLMINDDNIPDPSFYAEKSRI